MHIIKLKQEKAECFNAWLFKIFFIFLIFLLCSCKSNVIVPQPFPDPLIKGKLLILPFKNLSRIYGENISIRCPLCGNVFMTGEVTEDSEEILTQSLISLMEGRKGIKLIPSGQVHGVLSEMLSKDKYSMPERDQVLETGRVLGAQVVMAGYIYRFRERVGTKYSADSPASAAFDIHLVDVASGRILWTGRFDETQRSLSENLFNIRAFFRRKGEWITVNKMAVSALEDMIQKLPEIDTDKPEKNNQTAR